MDSREMEISVNPNQIRHVWAIQSDSIHYKDRVKSGTRCTLGVKLDLCFVRINRFGVSHG